jgi:hypothetical protein
MFKSAKRTKKKTKKKTLPPLTRAKLKVTKLLGRVTPGTPQKGKANARSKAKRAGSGARRGTRSTSRKAKTAAR